MKKIAPYVIVFLAALLVMNLFNYSHDMHVVLDGDDIDGPVGAFFGLLAGGIGLLVGGVLLLVVGAILAVVIAGFMSFSIVLFAPTAWSEPNAAKLSLIVDFSPVVPAKAAVLT